MRVAVVSMETVHHHETPWTRRLSRVASLLAAAGHEVTVYCARWWDDRTRHREVDGVTYRAVTPEPAVPSFCSKLPFVLARQRPTIVHASAASPTVVLAAKAGASTVRTPLIVDWYGDEAPNGGRTVRQAAKRPDMIVTPSELIRTEVRERGASGDATTVVPDSIDFGRIRNVDPGEQIDVAFAHRLDDDANVESLLLGLAELREREWTATVIGDGPAREDYEQQAADLRIDDRVHFAGECDRDRQIEILRGAHVFVQSAYRECFARELLWALACGCVGIVEYQARSSAHELIERRDRSYRVTSTQEMAAAIVDAGEFEHRTIDDDFESFDHDAVRETYEHTYEVVLENHGLVG